MADTASIPAARPTQPPKERMTVDEFLAWDYPDGERWELLQGVPEMAPSPEPNHQHAQYRILLSLAGLDPNEELGIPVLAPADLVLPGGTVVQPDIMILAPADATLDRRRFDCTPRLVIEILSPSTRQRDEGEKLDLYEAAGIGEYWLVDPQHPSLTIHRLTQPSDGGPHRYALESRDADGFTYSDLYSRELRILRVDDTRYRLESRTRPGS